MCSQQRLQIGGTVMGHTGLCPPPESLPWQQLHHKPFRVQIQLSVSLCTRGGDALGIFWLARNALCSI